MKIIQKNLRIMYFTFGFALFGVSCSKEEIAPSSSNEITANVQTNATRFKELTTNRVSDPFDITGFVREGDLLKINVSGGCETNAYKVVWDGVINFSSPPMVSIVVSYEPTLKVQCLYPQKHTVIVDLKKMIGDKYVSNIFHVVVSNASKEEDKLIDPSGTVTTKKNDSLTGTWLLKGSTGNSPASKLVFSESGGNKILKFDCSGAPTAGLPTVAETPYKFENNKLSFVDYITPKNGYYDVTSFEWVVQGKEFTVKFHQILHYISNDSKVNYVKVE
jgi:hypothetical protein